jgi:uncharacterized membrane protein HdeD (DUF308 family)
VRKPISTSLLLSTILGALLIVGGVGSIVLDLTYHYGDPLLGPILVALLGVLLIVLAIFAENPGPWRRAFVIARDSLILLFCIGLLLLLLRLLIGPLH